MIISIDASSEFDCLSKVLGLVRALFHRIGCKFKTSNKS